MGLYVNVFSKNPVQYANTLSSKTHVDGTNKSEINPVQYINAAYPTLVTLVNNVEKSNVILIQ
jgi:hypothetical protein